MPACTYLQVLKTRALLADAAAAKSAKPDASPLELKVLLVFCCLSWFKMFDSLQGTRGSISVYVPIVLGCFDLMPISVLLFRFVRFLNRSYLSGFVQGASLHSTDASSAAVTAACTDDDADTRESGPNGTVFDFIHATLGGATTDLRVSLTAPEWWLGLHEAFSRQGDRLSGRLSGLVDRSLASPLSTVSLP